MPSVSQMIRVPTALIAAVKDLSRLHRAGYTDILLSELQRLIAKLDSSDSSLLETIDSNADSKNSGVDSNTDSTADSKNSGVDSTALTALDARLADLEQQIASLNNRLATLETSPQRPARPVAVRAATAMEHLPPPANLDDWLTTGEAFKALAAQGFSKTLTTFRRWLAATIVTGQLPPDLEQWGLVIDLAVRRQANPKDNSVRWLKIAPNQPGGEGGGGKASGQQSG